VDNLCHTLVGAAIGEAGLKTRTRFGAAALMISANIPDLDVLSFLTDTSPVAFRRGLTHGIVAQIALPVAMTGAFWLWNRWRRPANDGVQPFHAGWLLALCYVGVYSHVFLDYLNNYGVRLLTPFDWRWFYGDSVFIVDIWMWLVLGIGVWLSRRQHSTTRAWYAVAIATIYIVAMLTSARVARGIVTEQWAETHGAPPPALMVGPWPLTPLTREVIVDAGDHYEHGSFSWPSRLELSPEHIAKNDQRPEVAAARADPRIRALLIWSRFPIFLLDAVEGGTRVTVTDARFMSRGGAFSASTVVPTHSSASD
jgi:inner membrane protein